MPRRGSEIDISKLLVVNVVCGGQLVARPDDTPEALADRLRDYHTKPVLDLFRRKELVLDIDGTTPPEEIQLEIRSRLGV